MDEAPDEGVERQPSVTPSEASGAKWFVIVFLLVVPALSITLLVAIVWALWSALFRE